jgi:UDP-N-acetylglucosamine 3-dehydrogenase
MLRPLVVGGGTMGALHLRALLAREDVRSVVLVEPDRDRREALVRQAGLVRTYARLDEALDREELDLAIAAVPLCSAFDVVTRLLEGGLPVLAEKPLATRASDAQELAGVATRSGALLSVGYIERFNPAVQALKQELQNGDAGPVYHVHARRLSAFPYREGMAGVTIDVATHDLDVLGFITGSWPVRVYAETAVRQGGEGEDLLCASLRFENGVTGLVESNWLTPMKVRRLTVTAERGMYVVDYVTQDLWLHEHPRGEAEWDTLGVVRGANEGRTIRFGLDRREPLVIEHERFIDAVATGGPAPVTVGEAVAVLSAAEAIIESGRTNQPVTPARPVAR